MAKVKAKVSADRLAGVEFDPAKIDAAETAIFEEAQKDPAIVAAAGITNGMPADLIREKILFAAFAAGEFAARAAKE